MRSGEHRRRYDAARTLSMEWDLAQLSDELAAVVEQTMQPAHVSLWPLGRKRPAPVDDGNASTE